MLCMPKRKVKMLSPKELIPEEGQYVKLFDVLKNVDSYLKDGNEVRRFRAIKDAKSLYAEFDLWTVGTLQLSKQIDSTLKVFKTGFSRRLVPSLKSSDRTVIMTASDLLKQVALYLLEPTVDK